jgi:hypothetical protein
MSVSDKNFESFVQKFAGTLLEHLDALKGSKQVLLLADDKAPFLSFKLPITKLQKLLSAQVMVLQKKGKTHINALVMDGIITQRLVDLVNETDISIVVAEKMGPLPRKDVAANLYTRRDLEILSGKAGIEVKPSPQRSALTVRKLRTLWKEAAPEEWKELEKIDKDAEVKDYQENGIWDIAGLRDDLKLMREKLGKEVKPSGKNDEKESEVGAILSPGNNDSSKKSDNSSVKSKLEVLRELKALLDEKIIDDEEFKKMKIEIIN